MIRQLIKAIFPVLLIGMQVQAFAQTCSCAGTPLLASLDTFALQKGEFSITYAAEIHDISDLVAGSKDVPNETGRDRNTFSQVLTGSYSITDRWAVSALVSYVEHNRTIATSFLGETKTSGISDSVVLARYTPLFITPFFRHQLSLGVGVRIPTGDDDFGDRFIISEDMQPSTGAFGSILWTSYSYAFNQAATLKLNLSSNYTVNKENKRKYAFGDEFVFAAGISHTTGTRFSYSAALRYRTTKADQRFGFDIPNTGGEWLDFVPAFDFAITNRLHLGLSGRIPVARKLNGTLQFTSSYSYRISVTYGS